MDGSNGLAARSRIDRYCVDQETGGARDGRASYRRGAIAVENTGTAWVRHLTGDWASTHPASGTWPGSEIAQKVHACSSCASKCRCASANDCPTHSTIAASKANRCSKRCGLSGALEIRFAQAKTAAHRLCPVTEYGCTGLPEHGLVSLMRLPMSYSRMEKFFKSLIPLHNRQSRAASSHTALPFRRTALFFAVRKALSCTQGPQCYTRLSDELNAPEGKRRMRTLSPNSALFLPRRQDGSGTFIRRSPERGLQAPLLALNLRYNITFLRKETASATGVEPVGDATLIHEQVGL